VAASAEQVKLLQRDTPPEEVKQRAGPGGMMLSYVDARYHFDTLDKCVGGENWQSQFSRDASGLRAGIGIYCKRVSVSADGTTITSGEWVWKWDVGTPSTMEPVKGEHSDAMKRAGVLWGIGRDLYDSASAASKAAGPRSRAPTAPSEAHSGSGGVPVAHVTGSWACPMHGGSKVVPAGISKHGARKGKPYPAFTVCSESTCDEKPPRGSARPAPVFVAPDPTEFIGMTPDDEDDGNPFDSIPDNEPG